jgi:nitrite reductase (NADH) small subunit
MAAFDVDGLAAPVLIVRRGPSVRATSGICPHEVVELEGGHVDGNEIVCPGHGYHFDLDSGACTPDPRLCLPTYQTTVEAGDVWIELVAGGSSQ